MTYRYRVEIAFTSDTSTRTYGADAYGAGNYGSGTDWTDVACESTAATIETGRRAPMTRPDVGRCSVAVGGWLPPVAYPSAMMTGRPFRLSVDVAGEWRALFTGTVEDARLTETIADGTVFTAWVITATDAAGALQRMNTPAGTYPRPTEPVLDRIRELCELVGIVYGADIRQPIVTPFGNVQASEVAQPVWQEIGIAADTAGLIVYGTRTGGVIVTEESTRPRSPQIAAETLWILGTTDTIPPDLAGPSPVVHYIGGPAAADLGTGLSDIANAVTVGNAGADARTITDPTSVADLGRRDYSRTDLIASTDWNTAALAADWLARRAGRLHVTRLDVPLVGPTPPEQVAAAIDPGALVYGILPADDTGTRWTYHGRTLGHTLTLTAEQIALTLYLSLPVTEET